MFKIKIISVCPCGMDNNLHVQELSLAWGKPQVSDAQMRMREVDFQCRCMHCMFKSVAGHAPLRAHEPSQAKNIFRVHSTIEYNES